MPVEIKPITEAPEFVAPISEKVNEIAAALKPLLNLKPGKGIKITVSQSDISISIEDNVGGGGLPTGSAGDMLYHDGDGWVLLTAPTGMTLNPSMRFDLETGAPYWEEPEGC